MEMSNRSDSNAVQMKIKYANSWMVLGQYKDDNENYFIHGMVDDVRIYKSSLDVQEVESLVQYESKKYHLDISTNSD